MIVERVVYIKIGGMSDGRDMGRIIVANGSVTIEDVDGEWSIDQLEKLIKALQYAQRQSIVTEPKSFAALEYAIDTLAFSLEEAKKQEESKKV